MKVVILSTFGDYGGAAVCSNRLVVALGKAGVDVELLTLHAYNNDISFPLLGNSYLSSVKKWYHFIKERLTVLFAIKSRKNLYKFSVANSGLDLLSIPSIQQADIIHLHWINFGMMSIGQLERLATEKKIVWTMHDMWAFTGGCHYAMDCSNYTATCDNCFYLKTSRLSKAVLQRKLKEWSKPMFQLCGTSNWVKDCAQNSSVFKDYEVKLLSTPIDTEIFKPVEVMSLGGFKKDPNQYYILFGAVDLNDERKGFKYLNNALKLVSEQRPNVHLLTFGASLIENQSSDLPTTSFGKITDINQLNIIYNLADVFVLPSIQDNLPNTVMESMSSGTPVVAFDSGGVKDMIDHGANGYLADLRDDQDLAEGILSLMDKEKLTIFGANSRKKIIDNYQEEVVVNKHLALYKELIERPYDL